MSSPVEQIKQRLTIVEVVSSYIKLQKAGANYKAVCPFHSEKGPSFYVSPAREIWHCFGCNLGGDMFEFVKQIEGVEFVEALRLLAGRAGVELRMEDPTIRNERTRILDLVREASVFYQKNLSENKEVLEYLKQRGLTEETIKNFGLGFSLPEEKGWRGLTMYLKSKGYSGDEAEKAGLAIKKAANDYYDRFRGRIMFPLFDASGREVGFSGRIFGPEKEGMGKYINTPQTLLYDKSKILYGFDRAKMEIRKKDSCVLVEGQMDVIMSHQAGVLNAVAVSGTALTPLHLEAIKRLTDKLVMAFDSDEAGLSAAKRSIDLALEKEFEVKAIGAHEGKDPADIVLKDSALWQKLVSEARHIIDFYLGVLREKYPNDLDFKRQVEKNVLPYLLAIGSSIERGHWIKEIAKCIGAKEESVLEELKKIFNKKIDGGPDMSKNKCEIPRGTFKKRKHMLAERLLGISLWKKDKAVIPTAVGEVVFVGTEKMDKADEDRMALEAELCYGGTEKLTDEINSLVHELKKEILKENLENLAKEIQDCENKCDQKSLEEKLAEFQKLSRELSGL